MSETPKKTWDDVKPKLDQTLTANGFEDAFIGVVRRVGKPAIFVYDYQKCVGILQTKGIPTEEEAIEWMEYNVVSAWAGEGTPGFMIACTLEEAMEASQ
jgi:hypothetical protein